MNNIFRSNEHYDDYTEYRTTRASFVHTQITIEAKYNTY
jgi:hypothetical protein